MGAMASQITSITIVYSTVYSDTENIKTPRHWPLCGEFTGERWIPRTNGQLRGKCFHFMTSSWWDKAFSKSFHDKTNKKSSESSLLSMMFNGRLTAFKSYCRKNWMCLSMKRTFVVWARLLVRRDGRVCNEPDYWWMWGKKVQLDVLYWATISVSLSCEPQAGVVLLTFRELSKIISRKYIMPEITFMLRILS